MARLLSALYNGEILDKEMTADFFKVLSTHKDSWIPRDLPDDLKIADKPGALEGVRNDSGVIFVDNRPYILCVMSTYLRPSATEKTPSPIFRSPPGACSIAWRARANMEG